MNIVRIPLFLSALGLAVACGSSENKADTVATPPSKEVAAVAEEQEEAPEATGPFAEFSFEDKAYDFGEITEGDVVSHVFTFTNTGEAPLVISKAKGSCGCTVPEYPKEPIAPGATGEIKVEFNSRNKRGGQNKTVTLTANTKETNTILRISAQVKDAPAINGPVAG